MIESNKYKWIFCDELWNIYSNRRNYKKWIKKYSLHLDAWWYLYFHTKENWKWINIKVHKIIAECFIWDRPDWFEINHKDWNKQNNIPSNLEYVTRSENIKHAYRLWLAKPVPNCIDSIRRWRDNWWEYIHKKWFDSKSSKPVMYKWIIYYWITDLCKVVWCSTWLISMALNWRKFSYWKWKELIDNWISYCRMF